MNCPNCNAQETTRIKVCQECGHAYESGDLLALRQLEFLMEETAAWNVAASIRQPYRSRLKELRGRLIRTERPVETVEELHADDMMATTAAPTVPVETSPPALQAVPAAEPEPALQLRKPKPSVPFDQWLLSERNIKLALYSGGLLLVLAGLIFIGVNWTRIPGPGKFAITLMITGLMYLGGFVLFKRQSYRIGGVAMLGIASGFLPLNFAVLQIYVLGAAGLQDDVMWLIASPICLLIYLSICYWTRAGLFVYISVAAIASTVSAALVVTNGPPLLFTLAAMSLVMALAIIGFYLRKSSFAEVVRLPLLLITQVGVLVTTITAFAQWFAISYWNEPSFDSPWLAIAALVIAISFYIFTDQFTNLPFEQLHIARWPAAFLAPIVVGLVLAELEATVTVSVILVMLTAFALVGLGGWLQQAENGTLKSSLALYAAGYGAALFITAIADESGTSNFILALFIGIALIVASARIHRNYHWIYGATWLAILPVSLTINLLVPDRVNQGLLLGLLGLNYTVIGYYLGRRALKLGGPFLTAAVALTLITAAMTWSNATVAAMVLATIATQYLLIAYWQEWQWLLLPAGIFLNLTALAANRIFLVTDQLFEALIITYAVLGTTLLAGGFALRRTNWDKWGWPLYLLGTFNLGGAYLASLFASWWLAVAVAIVTASFWLIHAWSEQKLLHKRKVTGLLTYAGLAVIFVSHFYLLSGLSSGSNSNFWPVITATLCGLYVLLSWFVRRDPWNAIYGKPLYWSGLVLLLVPLVGALWLAFEYGEPQLTAWTFGIAGLIVTTAALLKGKVNQLYLGIGAFLVVLWAVLTYFGVSEPQAYVAPAGLVLLAFGWYEKSRGSYWRYRLPTLAGLLALMGTAFAQSIPADRTIFALIVLLEAILAISWGVRNHSRGYVRVSVLAIILTGIVQLGPGFVDLSRWIQLGVTGTLLLGVGLLALFKRESILSTRQRVAVEWRQWNP